ncbi:MAG: DUF3604 domain-containing protein, partial [Bradymonadaceae bacterium]
MPLAEAHRTGWAGFVVLATALGGMVACSGADRSGATPKEESPPEDEHVEYTEVREKCEHRNPLRNVYFGDLHVHTKLSFDAYYWRTRNTPEDAYRFAKGERVSLTSGPGEEDRSIQLSRPLDFAAGTDHAEFIGEVGLCDDPESSAYGTDVCRSLRRETESDSGFRMLTQELGLADPGRSEQVCGPEGERCERSSRSVWGRIQRAADRAYDRSSSCSFTSFVGYEYSNARDLNNLHRNVVFRNADVPDRVISTIDEPEPEGLWRALREECLRADSRCDVLAIPHNSNMSSGAMFTRSYPGADSRAERRELARLRARMEPLMELYQHKGSMECVNGLDGALGTPDEFCDFEKIYAEDTGSCGGEPGRFGLAGAGCRSPRNYYRNILAAGLKEKWELGVDPYRLGAIASTDTHSGTPGAVVESNWKGHMGSNESTARKRLAGAGTNTEPQTLPAAQSPGG